MVKTHPLSAPGPFYVMHGECMACGAPKAEAATLMSHDDEDGQCFFSRQPSTPDEVNAAIRATLVSCCESLRYGGDDPEILWRFAESNASSRCDKRLPQTPSPNRRNAAVFVYVGLTFEDAASVLIHELAAAMKTGDGECGNFFYTIGGAACTYVWGKSTYDSKGHKIQIEITRGSSATLQLLLRENPVAERWTAVRLDKILRQHPSIRGVRWYASNDGKIIEMSQRPHPY